MTRGNDKCDCHSRIRLTRYTTLSRCRYNANGNLDESFEKGVNYFSLKVVKCFHVHGMQKSNNISNPKMESSCKNITIKTIVAVNG